jgi:GNAT superfamily N-acetyltransferase
MRDMYNTQFAQKADPYQGVLPEPPTKTTYSVTLLTEDDIPAFCELQQEVWNTLSLNQKHFLKLRTEDDLKIHFENRMPVVGIKDQDGNLVAQALVSYPFYGDAVKNLEGYPLYGSECVTAIVQSLAVHPQHIKKGLSQTVLEAAKDMAVMSGHVKILAKVATDNVGSSKSFLNSQFQAASHGKDPKLGYPVTYWKHSLYQGCSAASATLALEAKIA